MSAQMSRKLVELDRLVNDPTVLLDAARVWDLLDELASEANELPGAPDHGRLGIDRRH